MEDQDGPSWPGDLAVQLAHEFQDKWLATLDADMLEKLDEVEDLAKEKRRSIFTRMDFRWRPADAQLLEQVRLSAKMTLNDLYQAAMRIQDEFYAEMRVPVLNAHGVPIIDSDGRQVWERDSHGNYVESLDQITGQDVEKAILDMGRVRFVVASLHAQLLSDAILARHLYDDRYQAGYESLVEGTQGDRNAKASRESRRDKYKAYFHWHLYQCSNVFLTEINSFIRLLDRMAERAVWGDRRRRS
jgi:hypothetical protein